MIDITKLTEEDIDKKVIWTGHGKSEIMFISSFNESYIFIKYLPNQKGMAAYPRDLTFAPPDPPIKLSFKRPKF